MKVSFMPVAAAICAAATPVFALAQQATSPRDSALQEVIVTATKQAAVDVNKVPISISAYGQDELDTRGVKEIADLAAITPGLHFSQQNSFGTPLTNIEIRGIQSRTSAPTTAIYLDDTPLLGRANNVNIGANGAFPQVFDLDRVEVLRGPQGTVFGASSEGGAVRFITKQPTLTGGANVYARAPSSPQRKEATRAMKRALRQALRSSTKNWACGRAHGSGVREGGSIECSLR